MFNEYERQEFWKTKIKVINCNNKESWYNDKVGQVFEVHSTTVRDYYIKEDGNVKSVLIKDAEILN